MNDYYFKQTKYLFIFYHFLPIKLNKDNAVNFPPRIPASQNSQNIANPSTSLVNVVCVAFLLFKAIEHLHGFAKRWRADFYVCPTKWLNALPLSHKTHILTDHKKKSSMRIEMAAWTYLTRKCVYGCGCPQGSINKGQFWAYFGI